MSARKAALTRGAETLAKSAFAALSALASLLAIPTHRLRRHTPGEIPITRSETNAWQYRHLPSTFTIWSSHALRVPSSTQNRSSIQASEAPCP